MLVTQRFTDRTKTELILRGLILWNSYHEMFSSSDSHNCRNVGQEYRTGS